MKTLMACVALMCAAGMPSAHGQAARPAAQEKFFGRWKLDEARSKMIHPGDTAKPVQWRSYEPDGDRVKVGWGSVQGQLGTYSAKCDGALESSVSGKIRCRQAGPNTIEGEQLDSNDSAHRYYRRVVSPDGKELRITWYTDATRRRPTDWFVYTRL